MLGGSIDKSKLYQNFNLCHIKVGGFVLWSMLLCLVLSIIKFPYFGSFS